MEKLTEEEDLKGLEEEIDNAVDRLFVEMKRNSEEGFSMESPPAEPRLKASALESSSLEPSTELPVFGSPIKLPSPETSQPSEPSIQSPISEPSVKPSLLEPSYEFEKSLGVEKPLSPPLASSPGPVPILLLKSIDRMEAQLLSLEWEITGEKLEKAREEILSLKELLKQKADMTSILISMENVLNHMIKNEEGIRPPWIKFLLDSKETIKLLMREETGGEINIYKQLACLGIEARFSCLEGIRDTQISQPSSKGEEVQVPGLSIAAEKKIGEMSESVDVFMKRVEEIFGTIQQQIVKIEETNRKPPALSVEARFPAIHVTVFKINERLFGVESEKVFKLFKVPKTFEEKCSDQQKIRLRDVEVKMVDLKKLFAIQEGGPKEQIRILTVKDDGTYKGFMVDEVLKRVSILSERRGEAGGYFSGVVPFTYQGQAVKIPLLDLKKF